MNIGGPLKKLQTNAENVSLAHLLGKFVGDRSVTFARLHMMIKNLYSLTVKDNVFQSVIQAYSEKKIFECSQQAE